MPKNNTPALLPEAQTVAQALSTILKKEPRTSLNEAASMLSVRREALQQALRKQENPFRKIRLEVIIQLAKKKIGDSQSLKVVAFELGYSTERAFARAFRRHCGVSPSKYKQTKHL